MILNKKNIDEKKLYTKLYTSLKDQIDANKDELILELLVQAILDYKYYRSLQDQVRNGEKISLSLVQLVGTISSCAKRITTLASQVGLSLKSRKQCGLQTQPEEDSELVKILKEE